MSDKEKICEMSLPDFLNTTVNTGDWDILIGNGLGLALGEINPLFKEVFSFNSCHISRRLIEDLEGKDCALIHTFKNPELFLQYVRVKTLLHILEHYQTNLTNKSNLGYTCRPLLSLDDNQRRFLNYFSINYDPILYKSLFDSDIFKKDSMEDGFGEKYGKGKGLYFQYNEHTHFFNLHGAYYIFCERENAIESSFEHRKLKANGKLKENVKNKKTLIDVCMDEFRDYSEKFDEYIKKPEKKNYPVNAPLIIMEDRHDIKKKLLEDDEYLKIGYDNLKASTNIFTFGCSFIYDAHLLEAIFSGEGKTIALGHYGDEEKVRFQSYVKERNKNQHHIVWLIETKGIETKGYENLVWQKSGIV